MDNRTINIGQAISYGWTSVKKDFWYFVGMAAVTTIIGSIASTRDQHNNIYGIMGLLLTTWMTCGYMTMILSYQAGKKLPFSTLFTQLKYYWRVLLATILLGIMVFIGFMLFIIPGVYLALRFQFTVTLILDKGLGVMEAMKESSRLTQGVRMSLLGFGLVSLGIVLLGVLCLGVGVFVALPVVEVATIVVYRKLLTSSSAVSPLTV